MGTKHFLTVFNEDMNMAMTIRQAAQHYSNKLFRVRDDGDIEFLYAVYDLDTKLVERVGTYELCADYRRQCGTISDYDPDLRGRYLRLIALDEVDEQMEYGDSFDSPEDMQY